MVSGSTREDLQDRVDVRSRMRVAGTEVRMILVFVLL